MEFFSHIVNLFSNDTENNRRSSTFSRSSRRKSRRSKRLASSISNRSGQLDSLSSSNLVRTDPNLHDITLGSTVRDQDPTARPSPRKVILELVGNDMQDCDKRVGAAKLEPGVMTLDKTGTAPLLSAPQGSPLPSLRSPPETETLSEFTNTGFTSTDTTGIPPVMLGGGKLNKPTPQRNDQHKTPDARTLSNLGTSVKIRDQYNKCTDQFMNFLYLLLKTTLVKEYRNLHSSRIENDAPEENLHQLESLIDGIMSEIIFIHENKKSHLEESGKLGELMPDVFKEMNKVAADQTLCKEELIQHNIEEIRKSIYRTQSMHNKKSLKPVKRSLAERKRFETTLRKAIELGYLKDDPEIAKLLQYISDYDDMTEEMQKANAFMRGRQVGFHLWNNALKMFQSDNLELAYNFSS